MSAAGLDGVDESLRTTQVRLNEIMDDLGPDRRVAYRSRRAVLELACAGAKPNPAR